MYEGAVSWEALWEAPADEIEFLIREAHEINDQAADSAEQAKRGSRGRRRR